MNKIKQIIIKGIRGTRDEISFDLDERPILVFGENGTGKSTIADAFEWFYQDKVEHLVSEEISGKHAIRNIFLSDKEPSAIEIQFTNGNLDNEKSITHAGYVRQSNASAAFAEYKKQSACENLILRYEELVKFIVATKSERLSNLQEIIGFNEVKEMRGLLKKLAGKYAKEIKAGDFENRKSSRQAILIECLGRNIVSDSHFVEAINELVKPLKMGSKISSPDDIPVFLQSFEKEEDPGQIEQITSYNRIADNLSELTGSIDQLCMAYNSYYASFSELKKDQRKLQSLQLRQLLTEGLAVLKKDVFEKDFCPLCRQEKKKVELVKELGQRLEDLDALGKEYSKMKEHGRELSKHIQNCLNANEAMLKEKLVSEKSNESLKKGLEKLKSGIALYNDEYNKELLSEDTLTPAKKISISTENIKPHIEYAKGKAAELSGSRKGNSKLQVHANIIRALDAYKEYSDVRKKQDQLKVAKDTFEALYNDFIKRQEDALTSFLHMFSSEIDNYYGKINPGEKVGSIRLIPLRDKADEDMQGITIQFNFFDKTHKPPKYLLSESHIHCLGIAFFLASVKAFNKENRFFLLDDVISSFDGHHRARFIRMLAEEFQDYQIILLTHEKDFFDIAASEVKRKNWLISSLGWSAEKGTQVVAAEK
jgi:DNA repair exonuclease SbcCD ATPase subunit